jgi:hypothetical protein
MARRGWADLGAAFDFLGGVLGEIFARAFETGVAGLDDVFLVAIWSGLRRIKDRSANLG